MIPVSACWCRVALSRAAKHPGKYLASLCAGITTENFITRRSSLLEKRANLSSPEPLFSSLSNVLASSCQRLLVNNSRHYIEQTINQRIIAADAEHGLIVKGDLRGSLGNQHTENNSFPFD